MTMQDPSTDTTPDPTSPPAPPVDWSDVADASAAAQTSGDEGGELVEDVIQVAVDDAALAKIAKDNAADDLVMSELEAELESLKEQVKETKGEIDIVERRMKDRHEAARSGTQSVRGKWRVVDVFETNQVRYIDPETGKIMAERAMTPAERQGDLFARRNGSTTSIGDSDEELLADDDGPTDLEDRLDAALDEDDDVEIDATEVLEAVTSAEPSNPSATAPTRRRRKGT